MIVIAHRGNTYGPDRFNENRPGYIEDALDKGFDVEVDVWYVDNMGFMLGHDEPTYAVQPSFLVNEALWCHAKNAEALSKLLQIDAHCFWHQNDDMTLTSNCWIWTHPGRGVVRSARSVILAFSPADIQNVKPDVGAVCTDYAHMMQEKQPK